MAGSSIANLLDARFFDEAYRDATPVGETPTPLMQMFGGSPKDVFGDTIEVKIFPLQRTPAPTNNIGGVSKRIQHKGAFKRYYTPIHAFNHMPFDPHALMYLEMEDRPDVQSLGKDEINRQLEYFKLAHSILREVAIHKAFFDGVIYRDSDGNVTETDGGGPAIDLAMDATHQGNLGGMIAADWDDPAALLFTQLNAIKIKASDDGLPEPKHIFVTNLMKNWLRDNTEAKAYFQNANLTPESVDRLLQGDTFPNLGGFDWHFYDGTFVDSGGTSRRLVPQNKAVITPDNGPWMKSYNGSFRVPRSNDIIQSDSAEGLTGNGQIVYGDFFYMREKDDPATMLCYGGTTFLYAFAQPNAIWQPTVVT